MLHCIRLFVLVALTALAVPETLAHDGPVPKPRPPLTIRIEPAAAEVVGQTLDYRVSATSQVDADLAIIDVTLPAGAVVVSGASHWQGSLIAGQEHVLQFRASVPAGSRAPIVAEIAMGQEGESRFSARAVYPTLPPSEFAAAAQDKPRIVIRDGRRVEEYVLK